MTDDVATPASKRKRQRSPAYPGINLQTALERARELHQQERRNYAPVDAILRHWGYQPKSGGGLVVLSALIKFGLVEDEGSGPARRARLTDTAFKLIVDERPNSTERQQLIRDAALAPTIHRELWEEYKGDLPSDATLEYTLKTKRAFTDHAAKEFIREFRETIHFAGLDTSDNISEARQDKSKQTPPVRQGQTGGEAWVPPMSEGHAISIPIGLGSWAQLQAPFPLTETAWKQMMAVLEAMKPALVAEHQSTEVAKSAKDSDT